jgi:signal transduction histidine kinase
MEDVLLLARRVEANGGVYVQGCRLDWAALREWLLGQVGDLLPEADLQPLRGPQQPEDYSMLASLPVRLEPGEVDIPRGAALSPVRLSLLTAWGSLAVAIAAVGFLLHGIISLSERRADFVSAVTHELRTPLTTFQMYADMLADGIVRDDERRREYLETLRSQSYRLGHLVENVLAFARLESNRSGRALETLSLSDLIGRVRPRLEDHARRCGMELSFTGPEDAREATVSAEVSSVEQILFNLTDNACKYAAGPVEIGVRTDRSDAVITVRDYGPGIPAGEGRRVFRPFHKSARDAADSAPGVGLGLALSRRLAREMGGDLRLTQPDGPGARLELYLPLAT